MLDTSSLKLIDPLETDFSLDLLDEFSVKEPSCLITRDDRTFLDRLTGDLFYNWYARRVTVEYKGLYVQCGFKEWNNIIWKQIPITSFVMISKMMIDKQWERDQQGNYFFRINPLWHKHPVYVKIDKRFGKTFIRATIHSVVKLLKRLDESKDHGSEMAKALLGAGIKVWKDREEALRQKAAAEESMAIAQKVVAMVQKALDEGKTPEELDDSLDGDVEKEEKKTLH